MGLIPPSSHGGAAQTVNWATALPIVVPAAGTNKVIVDDAEPFPDNVAGYDGDTSTFVFDVALYASDGLDGSFLGPTFAYVTVQAGPPDPIDTYATPIVTDTTAVTGGSYAWDGSQYQQISAALS